MSKTSLKKTLKSLTRDQIMEVVLDLYEARKEAREYLEYFISPDERGMAEKTIATISKEFSPSRGKAKARTSVCRRAIKDFTLLHPSPRLIANVRFHYIKEIIRYSIRLRWWIKESLEKALPNMLWDTLEYCFSNDIIDEMHPQITEIIKTLEGCKAHTAKEAIETYSHFCIEKGITPVTG